MAEENIQSKIRNFCIIAHIDHGKSTLADRMLEMTQTIAKREMKEQILDQMDLERERGITIKLAPVRMEWSPTSRTNADRKTPTYAEGETRNNAESKLLYEDLTYKIRGAVFEVKKQLGLGHKELVYQQALEKEFILRNINFEKEKRIPIKYKGQNIGVYQPDFIVNNRIIVELKSLPFIGKNEKQQIWSYLKGSDYKLLLLINFSGSDLSFKRLVYDTARQQRSSGPFPRESASGPRSSAFILNLIDTPGHVDFSYEVSRSLAAVEGAILLVDAAQGIEAQTLSTLYAAIEHDLKIIPVVNKIDLPAARPKEVKQEIIKLLGCRSEEIILASGKTGEGVEEILQSVIERIPSPSCDEKKPLQALIFDSVYDPYRGVVAYVRVMAGKIANNDDIFLIQTKSQGRAEEVGIFSPKPLPHSPLSAGEIGYIVSGFKSVLEAAVGDTITLAKNPAGSPLSGYKIVKPYVFASIFSAEGDNSLELKDAIEKLKLNDASLSYEPERSEVLGSGFRCGFLGLLHMDIVRERLEREFDLDVIVTTPTVEYHLIKNSGEKAIALRASQMPEPHAYREISEPWASLEIITPKDYIGAIMDKCQKKRAIYKNTEYFDDGRAILKYEIPLAELIVDFYDQLKSVSSGYASMNYEILEWRPAELSKIDILIAEEKIEPLSFIVYTPKAQSEARRIVERLKELIPRQNFEVKIQAAIGGTIIASERISPLRKDVTAKLYGGDVTRKNKLLDKQKKGKKRMGQIGKVQIPSDIFIQVMK